MPASFIVDDRPDGVRVFSLSNPSRKNALDDTALVQLQAGLNTPPYIRALYFKSAAPGIFSAGYDVTELGHRGETDPLPDELLGDVLDRLMHHSLPSVAFVTGPAFGAGCELACACDFVVAAKSAVFCMPPAKLGVIYAERGMRRVAMKVGLQRAKFMLLGGRRIDASLAAQWGLADLASPDENDRAALELCAELAAAAPLSIAGMKRGFEHLHSFTRDASFETLRRAAFNSADAAEGRAAFLEKRAPRFKGG